MPSRPPGNLVTRSGLDLSQAAGFTVVAEKLNFFRWDRAGASQEIWSLGRGRVTLQWLHWGSVVSVRFRRTQARARAALFLLTLTAHPRRSRSPFALALRPSPFPPPQNPAPRYLSHFRSIHRGAYFAELRTTTVRKLLPESWGFLCPVHTPDGSPCGLLNHFTAACRILTAGPLKPDEVDAAVVEASLSFSSLFRV